MDSKYSAGSVIRVLHPVSDCIIKSHDLMEGHNDTPTAVDHWDTGALALDLVDATLDDIRQDLWKTHSPMTDLKIRVSGRGQGLTRRLDMMLSGMLDGRCIAVATATVFMGTDTAVADWYHLQKERHLV